MLSSKLINIAQSGGDSDQEAFLRAAAKACKLPLPTRIAFIGNFLPRECGIATFTTDLCAALDDRIRRGTPVCDTRQRP